MKISKEDLKNGSMTLVFHIGDKTYAPIMSKKSLDAIQIMAINETDELVEVDGEITVKESE